MMEKSTTDMPFASLADYEAAINHPQYDEDSEAGRLYRASVNRELIESPNIVLVPLAWYTQKRAQWLKRDGVDQ